MTINTNIPVFTADAQACVELAKAIAIVDGCSEVSGVHVVRAALHLHPEEATDALGVDSGGAEELVQSAGSAPAPQTAPGIQMRPSKSLARILRGLTRSGGTVGIPSLLGSIARRPCVRVAQLLASIAPRAKAAPGALTTKGPYRAAQEHLQDVHRLWRLRAAACDSDEHSPPRHNTNSTCLWSAAMALERDIESRTNSPARTLPIRNEATPAKEVLEGLIVHEFYGLEQWAPGLELRRLARLLLPGAGWLRVLADVTQAVTDLERRELVEHTGHSAQPRPTDRIRAADALLGDVLAVLREDPFTREEPRAFALRLRHLRAL